MKRWKGIWKEAQALTEIELCHFSKCCICPKMNNEGKSSLCLETGSFIIAKPFSWDISDIFTGGFARSTLIFQPALPLAQVFSYTLVSGFGLSVLRFSFLPLQTTARFVSRHLNCISHKCWFGPLLQEPNMFLLVTLLNSSQLFLPLRRWKYLWMVAYPILWSCFFPWNTFIDPLFSIFMYNWVEHIAQSLRESLRMSNPWYLSALNPHQARDFLPLFNYWWWRGGKKDSSKNQGGGTGQIFEIQNIEIWNVTYGGSLNNCQWYMEDSIYTSVCNSTF